MPSSGGQDGLSAYHAQGAGGAGCCGGEQPSVHSGRCVRGAGKEWRRDLQPQRHEHGRVLRERALRSGRRPRRRCRRWCRSVRPAAYGDEAPASEGPRSLRGDDLRCKEASFDGGAGCSRLPGYLGERRPQQVPVRQPLRHGAVGDGRPDEDDQHACRWEERGHRRLRLVRPRSCDAGVRDGREGDCDGDRPAQGLRGADGRLRGDGDGGGRVSRRYLPDTDRQHACHSRRALRGHEGRCASGQRRTLRRGDMQEGPGETCGFGRGVAPRRGVLRDEGRTQASPAGGGAAGESGLRRRTPDRDNGP